MSFGQREIVELLVRVESRVTAHLRARGYQCSRTRADGSNRPGTFIEGDVFVSNDAFEAAINLVVTLDEQPKTIPLWLRQILGPLPGDGSSRWILNHVGGRDAFLTATPDQFEIELVAQQVVDAFMAKAS